MFAINPNRFPHKFAPQEEFCEVVEMKDVTPPKPEIKQIEADDEGK